MKNSKNKSINGEVWSEFCDSLKRSGLIILNEKRLSDLDFYEGWRYLTRLTRLGLEMALENNDPYFPTFYSLSHETAKIGADNPDNIIHALENGVVPIVLNYQIMEIKAGNYEFCVQALDSKLRTTEEKCLISEINV